MLRHLSAESVRKGVPGVHGPAPVFTRSSSQVAPDDAWNQYVTAGKQYSHYYAYDVYYRRPVRVSGLF